MRIAIDASRTTLARVTGTEHYALELIRALIRHNKQHQFTLYFRNAPSKDLFPATELVRIRVIPFKRAWTHLRFAAAIWKDRPDLTFVPAHTLPFFFPGKALVTVHDLGYKYFPEAHTHFSRTYLDWTTRYSARRATHILADSQATSEDLQKFYGIHPDKISVVYPGVEAPAIHPVDLQAKYNIPDRYLLFIGTLQPRKNIQRIVQAYTAYRKQTDNPLGLVLAGGKGWLYDDNWVEGMEGVYLTGYIDEMDKGALYQQAEALIFPSLFEGFGFPVLEAMHCGSPIIGSTTSSLPELVSDAGLQVDPLNTEAITQAIIQITSDADLRKTLIERGYEQVKRFTWDAAALRVLQIINDTA